MRSAHWISARSASSACVIFCVNLRLALLLLVSVVLRVRAQCPAQCRCPSSYMANCASLALTKVPTDRFDHHVQNLDISDNHFLSLDKTSLRDTGVVSLVQLNASRNHISDIHEEAFLGQCKLQTVDLSSNSLVYIEPKTFRRNPSLERLSLSNNQPLRLPEGEPFLDSKSLRVLQLSNCNLSHIPPTTFQYLPNLQELDISHNKIEILNPLQNVGHLTLIDVGYNYLRGLDSDIFTASPKLIHLNLSYNRLRTLNITVMPQLTKVISSVDLNGNPWVCDCVMFDTVYSWCRNNSVDLGLVCSSPPKRKDNSWTTYENAGCDDDDDDNDGGGDVDDNTASSNQSENIWMNDNKLRSGAGHKIYGNVVASGSFSTKNQDQKIESDFTFMCVSFILSAILLSLLIVAMYLWCRLKPRPSIRTGPAQCDSEASHLSSTKV